MYLTIAFRYAGPAAEAGRSTEGNWMRQRSGRDLENWHMSAVLTKEGFRL